ncbi:AraC family transcriptional regulator [Nocardia terpenica]|uniref:Transcriptional regulator n=1 Tax=Nocardia terpenica TaxID=455432 RepID=A0A164ILL1_9NOCA|nr:AraC family transcriptional regulator [Nocardia terpenica]KZM69557.1 transcriptional regulator [Nocardia terpenica]NQE89147.1 helix-turn-helix transcriptional regulator [Nocardia terpenica]
MTADVGRALPRTCYPVVWLWPGTALYCGRALELAPHSGAVWCLAVGIDNPITIEVNERDPITARSALIPPRLIHRLRCHGSRMMFAYFDPASARASSCRPAMTRWIDEVGIGHADERRLVRLAATVLTDADDSLAQDWLDLAARPEQRHIDPRIAEVTRRIRRDPAAATPARELAEAVGLSESRLLHLFREHIGTSLRRFRLWARLEHAVAAYHRGHTITAAAAEAGFATPSHLADRFRSTFGLSVTALLHTGADIRPRADP